MAEKPLLRQNSELRADRIWNWTLPAYAIRLTDGRTMNVCPQAGACAKFCYALNGTFMFRNVRGAHERNLVMVLDHLDEWRDRMSDELCHKRFRPTGVPRLEGYNLQLDDWAEWWRANGGAAIRIHDSGDFFSREYLEAWIDIARDFPDVLFYAYTKEVTLLREYVDIAPTNFRWVYSMGGKQDNLIDVENERHADVFTDMNEMEAKGYTSQEDNDLLCILLPTNKIGVPANNIKHFNKQMDGRSFSTLQHERDLKISAKRGPS